MDTLDPKTKTELIFRSFVISFFVTIFLILIPLGELLDALDDDFLPYFFIIFIYLLPVFIWLVIRQKKPTLSKFRDGFSITLLFHIIIYGYFSSQCSEIGCAAVMIIAVLSAGVSALFWVIFYLVFRIVKKKAENPGWHSPRIYVFILVGAIVAVNTFAFWDTVAFKTAIKNQNCDINFRDAYKKIECHWAVAKQTKNINECFKIPQTYDGSLSSNDFCVLEVINLIDQPSIDSCKSLDDYDQCIEKIATKTNNRKLCDSIASEFFRHDCLTYFAKKTGNINECTLIPDGKDLRREACIVSAIDAIKQPQIDICYTLKSGYYDECMVKIAIKNRDGTICNNIRKDHFLELFEKCQRLTK